MSDFRKTGKKRSNTLKKSEVYRYFVEKSPILLAQENDIFSQQDAIDDH